MPTELDRGLVCRIERHSVQAWPVEPADGGWRLRATPEFARIDDAAVTIVVDHDDLIGLFCLAADPERRRAGLGTAMVRTVLARASQPRLPAGRARPRAGDRDVRPAGLRRGLLLLPSPGAELSRLTVTTVG